VLESSSSMIVGGVFPPKPTTKERGGKMGTILVLSGLAFKGSLRTEVGGGQVGGRGGRVRCSAGPGGGKKKSPSSQQDYGWSSQKMVLQRNRYLGPRRSWGAFTKGERGQGTTVNQSNTFVGGQS